MSFSHVASVACLAIALPLASMIAQTTSSTPSRESDQSRWSFSLGADPTRFDLTKPESGSQARMVANLTRSWQSAGSRWARHVSLMLGGDAPVVVQPWILGLTSAGCDCPMRISQRYAGFTAGASYDVFRVSRFTPYVTGGTGLYYNGYGRTPVREILTPEEIPLYTNGGSAQSKFSVGVNAGLGLKIRLGSHDLFIEQMFHKFDINQPGIGVYPLNVGIRF
jgi:hypothetical protein